MSLKQNTTSPPCTPVNSKAQTSRTAASNKIQISRSFTAVWCKDLSNACPGHHLHFRGCAREVFKYMDMIRRKQNHGGFLFMRVSTIAAHTKDFGHKQRPYSIQQVKRVLRVFQELGILSRYETRMIKRRAVRGWQMAGHDWWAEVSGSTCDFKHWSDLERLQRELMGNHQDETDNETLNETINETDIAHNETANETGRSLVIACKG